MAALEWLKAGTAFLRGDARPLIVGLAVTDVCNLRCRHCRVANITRRHMRFIDIVERLRGLHERGARFLYLEGGEPYLWRDGRLTIRDVVDAAREVGYLFVHIYTNGTRPLDAGADLHWVSIDGPPDIHRTIRGADVGVTLEHLNRSMAGSRSFARSTR